MATLHVLGVRINGTMHVCYGSTMSDDTYRKLVSERGLPRTYVAWHIDETELTGPSTRVTEIRKLPVVQLPDGLTSWSDYLKALLDEE